MPKHQLLKDTHCRAAKCPPGKKHLRLPDGDGLYLQALPSGSKSWVMRLWFPAPQKTSYKSTRRGAVRLHAFSSSGLMAANCSRLTSLG